MSSYTGWLHFPPTIFAELGVLPPMRTVSTSSRFFKGLQNICRHEIIYRLLLPSTLLRMFHQRHPSFMTTCILMQATLGLRAGQMLLITPEHFINNTHHHVPPFKKCKTSSLLPIMHVPPTLLHRFLYYAVSTHLPIVRLTVAQYERKFTNTVKKLGCQLSSHSARHAFATIQALLNVAIFIIAQHLCHADPETSRTYIHELSAQELQVIYAHPELFIPIQQKGIVSLPHCSSLLMAK